MCDESGVLDSSNNSDLETLDWSHTVAYALVIVAAVLKLVVFVPRA